MTAFSRAGRAPWGDARFYIGIVLVVASVLGVWLIVSNADRTTPVLQANRTIVPGEAVSSSDFDVVDVALGAAADSYLSPQDLDPALVARRTLSAGELLPAAALGSAASVASTTVVIESSAGLPAGITAGARVELWNAPQNDDGFDDPRILIADATVADLVEADGMLASDRPAVELVIDRSDVSDVLGAMTAGDALSVVPLGAE